jgi:glycosyltransferase involved in cell wall biosynthesis
VECELSVVMPCLNEVRTLESCIRKAQSFFAEAGVSGEIIVVDNGSTDGSQALATRLGVRVVSATKRGYGAALGVGFAASHGRYIVMGDSDDSYDFSALAPYLERLRAGDDLVVGNRYRGGIAPGAMPPMHRYLGNPMLSRFARLFFRVPLGDVYCGLRGLRRSALERLELQSSGMEFALEMVVKARLLNMKISEVPTTLSPDGRGRPPHLNTWRDGRRSLLLYFSSMPSGLLLYPGVLLMTLGVIGGSILVMTPITVFGVHFDVHTLLYCGAAVLLGFQLFTYSVILRFLMIAAKLIPPQPRFSRRVNRLKIEHGLGVGIALIAAGLAGVVWLLEIWQAERFGNLDPFQTMRIAIPSAIAITLGFQVAFAALFLSLVDWQSRASKEG